MKASSLAFVLMCLMSGPALAGGGGLNLGWNDCGGLPASQNEVFACDTNAGTHKLVASFVAPCCLTAVTRNALVIDNAKSTGPAACPGCATGVCIVLNSIHIIQAPGAPGGDALLTVPASRNWVTWQGGIGVDCYGATPVRNATWGSIKTLYR